MSLILVVEPENRHAEPLIRALTTDGYNVKVVSSRDEALRAAAYEAPSLVLVSSDLPGAAEMMDAFAGKRGGPGVLALVGGSEQVAAYEPHADQLLVEPISDTDYRDAVRVGLAQARGGAPAARAVEESKKLSSADIFGDVLAEVEQTTLSPTPKVSSADIFGDMLAELGEQPPAAVHPATTQPTPAHTSPTRPASEPVQDSAAVARPPEVEAAPRVAAAAPTQTAEPSGFEAGANAAAARPPSRRPPPLMDDEIQRKLELTLSGVLGTGKETGTKTRRGSRAGTTSSSDVDAMLSRTLSSLDLDSRSTKKRPSAPAKKKRTATDLAAEIDKLRHTPAAETAWPEVERRKAAPAAPAFRPVSAGQEFGQYTLLEKIAIGGMAEVWKARMKGVEGFQKTVAIKKILHHLTDNESFVNMFIDEAKLAAQLSHPNITHIYDLGKLDEDYYIAMEFVEGRNLRAILDAAQRSGIRIPVGVTLLIAARLASALDYAHRKRGFDDRQLGLVHRDVSPQNVLLSYEGDIKLCDFGIVKAVSRAQHTQMGALKGKLQYMSPEQARGQSVDARSDLFSLGSLIFEMLLGRRLFPGDNELSVLEAVRECNLPAPVDIDPSIPAAVDELVRRALSKDPDGRFQTAGEMQQRIESILHSLDPTPGQADLAALMHRVLTHDRQAPAKRMGTATPRPERPPTATPATTVEPTAKPTAEPVVKPTVEPPALGPDSSRCALDAAQTAAKVSEVAGSKSAEPVKKDLSAPASAGQAGDARAAVRADGAGEPQSDAGERTEAGEVVELIAPTGGVDPQLVKGESRGRWWILLLLLALAAAAVLAWTMIRGRSQPAEPTPATLTQPVETQPADPGNSSSAEPEGTADPAQEGPASSSPSDGETENGEGASGASSTAVNAAPAAPQADPREVERLVDEELARREALLRAEFEKKQQQLEAQLSAVQAAQQEAAASDTSSEEPAVSDSDPPLLRPNSRSLAWLVPSVEGEYCALVTEGCWPRIRARRVFTQNLNSGLAKAHQC